MTTTAFFQDILGELVNKDNKIDDFETKIKTLTENMRTCQTPLEEKIRSLQSELASCKRTSIRLQREFEAHQTQTSESSGRCRLELTKCKAENEQKQQEITRLNEELRAQRNETLSSRIMDGEITALRAANDRLRQEIQILKRQLANPENGRTNLQWRVKAELDLILHDYNGPFKDKLNNLIRILIQSAT